MKQAKHMIFWFSLFIIVAFIVCYVAGYDWTTYLIAFIFGGFGLGYGIYKYIKDK